MTVRACGDKRSSSRALVDRRRFDRA